MSDTAKRIANLKQTIEDTKRDRSRLEGQRDTLMSQLKELGCDTIEAAVSKRDELAAQIKTLEAQLEKRLTAMEDEYGL